MVNDPWSNHEKDDNKTPEHLADEQFNEFWRSPFSVVDAACVRCEPNAISMASTVVTAVPFPCLPYGAPPAMEEDTPYYQVLETRLKRIQSKQSSNVSSKDILATLALAKDSHLRHCMTDSLQNSESIIPHPNSSLSDRLYYTNSVYRHTFPMQNGLGTVERVPLLKYDEMQLAHNEQEKQVNCSEPRKSVV